MSQNSDITGGEEKTAPAQMFKKVVAMISAPKRAAGCGRKFKCTIYVLY